MDDRMDQHDVYKVESISDSYLVASGLPKRNGDKWVHISNIYYVLILIYLMSELLLKYTIYFYRHASEICRMALDLQAASGMIVRPDIRPKTIEIKCGIHTGPVVAGEYDLIVYGIVSR